MAENSIIHNNYRVVTLKRLFSLVDKKNLNKMVVYFCTFQAFLVKNNDTFSEVACYVFGKESGSLS